MTRRTIVLALAPLALAAVATARAADLRAGKAIVQRTCYACHGLNGVSGMSLYPNLAGQKEAYLAAQLRAFRDGSRKNPIMSLIAAHLSAAQMKDVAAYFASLKPSGTASCIRRGVLGPHPPG
jgi:cytochrome c553